VGKDERLANNMGLFLQKTNIIRDYLEDVEQGREFWPKEVSNSPFQSWNNRGINTE
jgi:farnesyl-diphosphate farnesyltransferase